MEHAQDGPVPGMEALLAERRRVEALARRLVRDGNDADDVAQDAWLRILRRPPAVVRSVRGWLGSVVRSAAADARRGADRRSERERTAAVPPEPPLPVPDLVARAEAHRALLEVVLSLEEPGRTVVLLRFFEGLEPAEIAARLGVPPGTVRSRLHRTLEILRGRLDRRWGGRRSWAVALLGPSALRLLPPESSLKGVLTMTARTKVAVGAAFLALLAAFLWSRSGDGPLPAPADPGRTVAAAPTAPPEEPPPLPPPPASEPPAAVEVPAAEDPPAAAPVPADPAFLRLALRGLPPRDPAPPPAPPAPVLAPGEKPLAVRGGGGLDGGVTLRGRSKWAPVPERGTASFQGTVLDGAGRPVAGADVVRVDPKGGGSDGDVLSFEWVATIATTGPDGTFEATRQPERPFRLAANYRRCQNRPRGFELHATVPVDPSPGQVQTGIVLRVPVDAAAYGTVEGVVVDEEGRPLPGCQVMAGFQDAWTGQDGRFRFPSVPAGEVAVSARKFAWGRWSGQETLEAGGTATLRIVLQPDSRGPNSLEGRVVDDAGAAVAGVRVWMGGRRDLARDTVTGPDGRFAFEGLPDVGEGTVSVSVLPDMEAGAVLPATVNGVRVPTAGLELRVERTVRLRVRFADRSTGEPLPLFAYEVKREAVVDGERRMVSFRSGSQYREEGFVEMRVPRTELHFFVEVPDRDPVHAAVTVPAAGDGPFEVVFEF